MVNSIWNSDDGRYVTQEGVQRCWQKANILPAIWNIDINNNVGHKKEEKLRKDECENLCNMMKMLQLKASEEKLNVSLTAPVLDNSFVNDGNITDEEWVIMRDTWIDLEEDPIVIDSIIDDEINKLDSHSVGDAEDIDDNSLEDGFLHDDDEDDDDINNISHIDVTNSFNTIQKYIKKNDLQPEISLSLDRLQRKLQQSRALSTKISPSILTFFKK